MNKANKTDIMRDAIAFGGGGFLIIFSIIQQIGAGREVMLAAVCIIPGLAGMLLLGMGVYSRKLRKWMYKTERRLNQLEDASHKNSDLA
jgi:hypothetical protein